jgi:hypothetical protein
LFGRSEVFIEKVAGRTIEYVLTYEGQATVNANNLKHANLIDFRNNVQRVELVAVLQCGSQRRDPGLSDDVR